MLETLKKMPSLRPLSVLAIRLPQLLGWTVEPSSFAEPSLSKEDLMEKKQKVTDSLSRIQMIAYTYIVEKRKL